MTTYNKHYVRLGEVNNNWPSVELGELLKAAVLAYLLGVTPAHAFRKYVKGKPVGVFWSSTASYLLDRVRGGVEVEQALVKKWGVGGSQGVPGVPR